MTSLTIEECVETIGTNVFYCCHGLKTVTVPQSVTKLGNAFNCCYFLEDAVILANITALPRGIFANCALKSVTLSATITKIEDYAFTGCHDLTDVYFKGTKAQWEKVEIGDVNGSILTATVHYNA